VLNTELGLIDRPGGSGENANLIVSELTLITTKNQVAGVAVDVHYRAAFHSCAITSME
jgi:hypothetical protein